MLNTLAKHAGFDLEFMCDGDISVDMHHTVEDSGIVLGEALYKALGDRVGIARYQSFTMAMDDALVMCAIDICNRSYYESNTKFERDLVGEFETQTVDEFFRSFADNAKINLHFVVLRGYNAHHIIVDDKNLMNARLSLVFSVGLVIKECLGIIGISCPDKM